MTMYARRILACSITLLTALGCASGGGGGGDEGSTEEQAPMLRGSYRLDTRINFSGRGAEDVRGVITFQDESFMNFVSDLDRTNVPAPCRYFTRGPRLETECAGYQFTFRMDDDGRIRVDIRWRPEADDPLVRGSRDTRQGTGIGYLVKM